MVLPRMKQFQEEEGFYLLPFEIALCVGAQYEEKTRKLVALFLPGSKVCGANENAHIIAVKTPKKIHEEEYRLVINKAGVSIEFCTYRGLRNALATLSMMAYTREEGFLLKHINAEDYPVAQHRGIMLDLARGIKPIDTLKADILLAAKAKMNILHLHLYDSKGVCFKMDCLPRECCLDNCYTKDQMREIVHLAEVLALEIIPEFDMPAHSKKLVGCLENLACDVDGTEGNTRWTVCAGTEDTYILYEQVINEIAELFPGEYIHVGGDELEFRNRLELEQLCHWNYCRKCRKKMEEEHLADRQELLHYLLLRIYAMVKKAGRKMMMWSDQLDCNRPAVLPKDIRMQFWRVAGKGNGPRENCSMNNQLKMGYTLINSHFPETYVDFERYMTAQSISDWRWDRRPETEPQYAQQILGSEICAWEYGNHEKYAHYDRSLASTMMVMADKLWNGDVLNFDEAYETALTKAVLGTVAPEGLNIFRCIGSVLPPRENTYAYWDQITCTKEDIAETLVRLESLQPRDYGEGFRLNAYKDMLHNVLAEWEMPRREGDLPGEMEGA